MTSYNLSKSLTSKAFGRLKGTRYLSKSMEFLDVDKSEKSICSVETALPSMLSREHSDVGWKEISSVKAQNPVVACLLPALSMDFVASSLLAVGATPLITEDPTDVPKDLANCRAVLVDLCAPAALLESFMNNFNSVDREIPVVLALSNCGACDRKRDMAIRVLETVNVAMISGRMGDIVAVTQGILEKDVSPLESLSDDSCEEASKMDPALTCNVGKPGAECAVSAVLPPAMRRAKMKNKQTSKTVPDLANTSNGGDCTQAAMMPPHRNSPLCNSSPRGARKCINMKKNKGFERVPTILPIVGMKGQFRETQMSHVKVGDALEYAQKLCAHTNTYVHLYETNTVTSGEVVIEIMNTQVGMGNLHSTLPCSAGIAAAVLACVQCIPEYERILVEHCSRALSLFYVASSKATYEACKNENGLVSPGTLRQAFIDILHSLSPQAVKSLSEFVAHSVGLKTSRD